MKVESPTLLLPPSTVIVYYSGEGPEIYKDARKIPYYKIVEKSNNFLFYTSLWTHFYFILVTRIKYINIEGIIS
jgi:hypothetical protein